MREEMKTFLYKTCLQNIPLAQRRGAWGEVGLTVELLMVLQIEEGVLEERCAGETQAGGRRRRLPWASRLREWIHTGTVLANTMWRGGAALMRRCFYDSGLKGIGTLLFYFSIINYALGCQVPPGFSGNTRQKLVLLPGF